VDGDHIRTLLYTLFWRYMRPMIEAGRLYVAVAPLYLLRKGRQASYAYSDRERDAILGEWGAPGRRGEPVKPGKSPSASSGQNPSASSGQNLSASSRQDGVTIQRYKGLGEMNPEQLRETVFRVVGDGPFNDSLRRVTVEDVHHTNLMFSTLMGNSAQQRRDWLVRRWSEEQNDDNTDQAELRAE
jgi:DNA gyrase subunit B